MDAGPAHRRPLQLHRIEDRHRIDQSGSRRTPLDFPKRRLPDLIRPFKSKRISRELRSRPQRFPIGNIVINKHQPVGRHFVFLYVLCKPRNLILNRLPGHHMVLHHIKALLFQPLHLINTGIMKVHALRPHKAERIEAHVPLRRDLIVKLAHGPAA